MALKAPLYAYYNCFHDHKVRPAFCVGKKILCLTNVEPTDVGKAYIIIPSHQVVSDYFKAKGEVVYLTEPYPNSEIERKRNKVGGVLHLTDEDIRSLKNTFNIPEKELTVYLIR